MRPSIRAIGKEIELPIIYFFVTTYLVLKLLSIWISELANHFSPQAELFLIVTLVFLLLRRIEAEVSSEPQIREIKEFAGDLSKIFNKRSYNEILIFALDGTFYHTFFKQGKIRAKSVKLLLRRPSQEGLLSPENSDEAKAFYGHNRAMLYAWKGLLDDETIKEISIHYYDFESILHYMIADNEAIHFGLLKPKPKFPGSDVLNSYVVEGSTKESRALILNFRDEFECLYDPKFSTPFDDA